MQYLESEWQRKGATLSDKTACKEFGLTQDEILQAIGAGSLHCQEMSMHGNPWFRLLRREVETLVACRRGSAFLEEQKARTELARVNLELRRLKREAAVLEERRRQLSAVLGV